MHEEEAFLGVLDSATKGYVIVDSGATCSIAGMPAAMGLQECVRRLGVSRVLFDPDKKEIFRFVNGQSMTTTGMALSRIPI